MELIKYILAGAAVGLGLWLTVLGFFSFVFWEQIPLNDLSFITARICVALGVLLGMHNYFTNQD